MSDQPLSAQSSRNIESQRRETPHPHHTGVIRVAKQGDGTVTTRVEPSPGVIAVAVLLRTWYVAEYDTDAPVSDWYPDAIKLVAAYMEAEGQA